jgi:hypothetical protein
VDFGHVAAHAELAADGLLAVWADHRFLAVVLLRFIFTPPLLDFLVRSTFGALLDPLACLFHSH